MKRVEGAIRAWANRKVVGPDGLPAELLKVLADEEELDTLGKFHDISVAVWRGGSVPQQQWKRATITVLYSTRRKIGRSVVTITIVASPSWLTPAKRSSK